MSTETWLVERYGLVMHDGCDNRGGACRSCREGPPRRLVRTYGPFEDREVAERVAKLAVEKLAVDELTYEDAARPRGEPLSVVPPLSFWAAEPLR